MSALFDYQPVLHGPLLTLRPVAPDDFAPLFAIGADPALWAGHPNTDRYLEPQFRAYFEDGLQSGGALVARLTETGAVIGWSRYSSAFVQADEIEIGWTFLGRAYWGGAYNAEMKRMMLAHAFRFVPRVVFRIAETNQRSRRAAEKIGARLSPDRRTPSASPGGPDNLFYLLERDDVATGR